VLRRAPKVLLHDHLDGGLRPATVVDLARETGYAGLPSTDPDSLGGWFVEAAASGSLEKYLETFAHTVGVMQTREALSRVAPSARRTSPPTVSSTPRCATPPSSTSTVA
jgi:adenosine deaminase